MHVFGVIITVLVTVSERKPYRYRTLKKVQKKLTEAMDTQNALEHEREQQDETIRELEVNLKQI